MERIAAQFQGQEDFQVESIELDGQSYNFLFLSTLADHQWLEEQSKLPEFANVLRRKKQVHVDEVIEAIIQGEIGVFHEQEKAYSILAAKKNPLNRSISYPQSENVVMSAMDAFHEDLFINIGLIRKRMKTKSLQVRTFTIGKDIKRTVAVLFFSKENSEPKLANYIISQLASQEHREVTNFQDFNYLLGQQKYLPVQVVYPTELPAEAAQMLEEGRVVCFLDQYPFAIVTPSIISDVWRLDLDKNYPMAITLMIRFFRLLAILISIVTPAAYVSFIAVNPEVFPLKLALSVAKTREGIPYTALVEVIIMLLVLDLIVEASLRLPKSVGPTITMVGGIILGQAAVQAQIVSNLLIIVLSATAISNFAVVGYNNAMHIRIYRIFLVLISSIYGVIGLSVGMYALILFFGSVTTVLGIPFATWRLRGKAVDSSGK